MMYVVCFIGMGFVVYSAFELAMNFLGSREKFNANFRREVIDALRNGPMTGRELRKKLMESGVKISAPEFYFWMDKLEDEFVVDATDSRMVYDEIYDKPFHVRIYRLL